MADGSAPHGAAGTLFDLDGRVAVVTGAASGLGRVIAAGLAAYGASVYATDINEDGLGETVDAIRAAGGSAQGSRCDVSDETAVQETFGLVDSALGQVDILVNDAFTPVEALTPQDYPLEAWQRSISVNLTGSFLNAREAGRRMIAQGTGGSIVNLSSIAGSSALGRGSFAYSVAKHGINGLTRELAVEWARYGIRVNAIQPCQFLTPGLQFRLDEQPDPDALVERMLKGIPLDRLGDPERDMVGPVVFLASDAASMVTGTMLPVDGGNLAMNAGGSKTW